MKLTTVRQFNDLGVIFTSDLNFGTHLQHITCCRSSRTIGFINGFLPFNDPYTYITLYNALVRPILENASPIWTPIR